MNMHIVCLCLFLCEYAHAHAYCLCLSAICCSGSGIQSALGIGCRYEGCSVLECTAAATAVCHNLKWWWFNETSPPVISSPKSGLSHQTCRDKAAPAATPQTRYPRILSGNDSDHLGRNHRSCYEFKASSSLTSAEELQARFPWGQVGKLVRPNDDLYASAFPTMSSKHESQKKALAAAMNTAQGNLLHHCRMIVDFQCMSCGKTWTSVPNCWHHAVRRCCRPAPPCCILRPSSARKDSLAWSL